MRNIVLLTGIILNCCSLAGAQKVPKKTEPQYVYVEKLPELPGGGGQPAVVAAIQQRIVYPPTAIQEHLEGRVKVWFVVKADGSIGTVRIMESLRADCDSAVAMAVRQLPRFEPGIVAGQPSAIGYTVPITFQLQSARRPRVGIGSSN